MCVVRSSVYKVSYSVCCYSKSFGTVFLAAFFRAGFALWNRKCPEKIVCDRERKLSISRLRSGADGLVRLVVEQL